MKKKSVVCGLVLAAFGSAFALENKGLPVEVQMIAANVPPSGGDRIAQLRLDFAAGKFNSLFEKLEADYVALQESGRLEEFAEMRRVIEANAQMKGLAEQFDKMAAELLQERNDELKTLCKGLGEDLAARRISSVTAPEDESEKAAMRYIASLSFKTPEQASGPDERALIEIDLAYEFKSIHLDAHQGDEADLNDKQIALGMEKMRKMQEAAQSFQDTALKEKVALAAQGFDACQAKNLDLRELFAAARKPSSDLDRKIGAVLAGYKAKKEDLYQKEFLAKLQS